MDPNESTMLNGKKLHFLDNELNKSKNSLPDSIATVADAESVLSNQCWWSFFVIRHISTRLSVLTSNHTNITPNQLTWAAFLMGIAAAVFFYLGEYKYLVIGSVLFEVNYLLDCMDGTVARLKGSGSVFGGVLDHTLDRIRSYIVLLALIYGQYRLKGNIQVFFWGLSYLFGNMFFLYTRRLITENKSEAGETLVRFSMVSYLDRLRADTLVKKVHGVTANLNRGRYRRGKDLFSSVSRFQEKVLGISRKDNLYPYPTDIEAETLAFLIFPIINRVSLGLTVAAILIFLVTLLFVFFHYSRVKETRLRSEAILVAENMVKLKDKVITSPLKQFEHSYHSLKNDETKILVRLLLIELKKQQLFKVLYKNAKTDIETRFLIRTIASKLANDRLRKIGEIELKAIFRENLMLSLDPQTIERLLEIVESEIGNKDIKK